MVGVGVDWLIDFFDEIDVFIVGFGFVGMLFVV